ncbi:hypothetical protein [Gemmatimonas sp.]
MRSARAAMLAFAILVLVALYLSATAPVEPAAVTEVVPARPSDGRAP